MRFQSMTPEPGAVMSSSSSLCRIEGGDLIRRQMRQRLEVLHVHQGEAAGIALEIGDGIFAGNADPAQIHFHLYEIRIGRREQVIVRQLAAEAGIGSELPPVIVVGELDVGFLAGFAGFVEGVDDVFPAVGGIAFLFVDPRADDEGVADGVSRIDGFWPMILDNVVADVAGWRGETVLVEDALEYLWGNGRSNPRIRLLCSRWTRPWR